MKQIIYTLILALALAACNHEEDIQIETGMATVGAALDPSVASRHRTLPLQRGSTPQGGGGNFTYPSVASRHLPFAGEELPGYGNQAVAAYSDPSVASRHLPFAGEELPGYGNQTTAVYSDNPTGHNSPIPPLQRGGAGLPAEGSGEYPEAGRGSSTRSNPPSPPFKLQFSLGDPITLSHYHGAAPVTTTMIFDGTQWLNQTGDSPAIPVNIAGPTAITARHSYGGILGDGNDDLHPAPAISTYADLLEAGPTVPTPAADGNYHIQLTFTHARALIHIYKVADANGNPTGTLQPGSDLTLTITDNEGQTRTLATTIASPNPEADPAHPDATNPHAYLILPPGARIQTIAFSAAPAATPGVYQPYTAYNANPGSGQTMQPNTRYTPRLDLGTPAPTFTLDAGNDIDPWNTNPEKHGDTYISTYTHFIATYDNLKELADEVNTANPADISKIRALQTAPIVFPTNSGSWTPIGKDFDHRFTGLYNGDGYTISGLTINSGNLYAGLFGYLGSGARITGVHLRDVDINNTHSDGRAGALAGDATGARIALCSSTGLVTATYAAGGLVGGAYGGTHITRSSSHCRVQATRTTGSSFAGGLVGHNASNSTLLACMAGGKVTGADNYTDSDTGALVGFNSNGTIAICYATGIAESPVGSPYTGGLLGRNGGSNAQISHSYTSNGKLVGVNGTGIIDGATCWSPQENGGFAASEIYNIVTRDGAIPGTFAGIITWTGNDDEFQSRTLTAPGAWKKVPGSNFPTVDYSYTGSN